MTDAYAPLDLPATCDRLGVTPPEGGHPTTAEPFTSCSVEVENDAQLVSYGPPRRPEQEYTEQDWCDCCGADHSSERRLTDAEYAAALRRYEKAKAEYDRTGGRAHVRGETTVRGTFTCDSGSEVSGVYDGKAWVWTEWSVSG